jgi:hypothetical protein
MDNEAANLGQINKRTFGSYVLREGGTFQVDTMTPEYFSIL